MVNMSTTKVVFFHIEIMVVQKSVEQIKLNEDVFNPKEALENLA